MLHKLIKLFSHKNTKLIMNYCKINSINNIISTRASTLTIFEKKKTKDLMYFNL